ncbi:MAG: hypothetical protein FJY79_12080, partial [Candidatus Aminicenantes bacterium]|nr:hypothetical protein [Candidatus Aminicenantes bacterium]
MVIIMSARRSRSGVSAKRSRKSAMARSRSTAQLETAARTGCSGLRGLTVLMPRAGLRAASSSPPTAGGIGRGEGSFEGPDAASPEGLRGPPRSARRGLICSGFLAMGVRLSLHFSIIRAGTGDRNGYCVPELNVVPSPIAMDISGDQLTRLMIDAAWLSLLLLVGKYLRTKVRLFQRLFLPASVLAGFIGLVLGPYIAGRHLFTVIPSEMMNSWALYPGRLINVVFACLFLGFAVPSLKSIWREGGPQLCYGWMVGMGQYIVGVGITVLLLKPVFGVPDFFGCLLEIGFSGGHGTAAGMAEAFTDIGFPAGSDLGLMSATVGIICAVVFGMAMVNMA